MYSLVSHLSHNRVVPGSNLATKPKKSKQQKNTKHILVIYTSA